METINNEQVLIIGSAPSISRYLSDIKNFNGVIWALNDAWFWLESNNIIPDMVYVTDGRFFKKSLDKITDSRCKYITVNNETDISKITCMNKEISTFTCLGRDGFSISYGKAYHGCSVFFTALQTAFSLKYMRISVCGVLLPPPGRYNRISGATNMPEYVHSIQIKNARKALKILRKFDVKLNVFEPESNLNFL